MEGVTDSYWNLMRLARLMPLAAAAAAVAVAAMLEAGLVGGLLVASSLVLAAALVAWSRPAEAEVTAVVRRFATAALLLVPVLLVVFFAFSGGGFFPDSVAVGALLVALLLVLRCSLGARPLASLGPAVLVPLGALALFTLWVFLSSRWSHAPGRAIVEADRALLYLLTFTLFGSLAAGRERLAVAVRLIAAGMVLVAAVSLLSRLAPDVLSTSRLADPTRLAYPLSYWNALGVFCAIAAVLCLHLAGSTDEPRIVRVLATAALPVVGTTLLLTFSRGANAAAVLGLVVYVIVGRPRALLPALVAAGPLTAVALHAAYNATLLAGTDPTSAAAVAQGHSVARTVVLCSAGALVVRALLVLLADGPLERARFPEHLRGRLTVGAWAGFAVLVVALVFALHVPSAVSDGWHEFTNAKTIGATTNTRDRLGSTSNQGRLEHWRAALEGYREHPLSGTGAGTFPILWSEHRRNNGSVIDAHSLYAETLGELGVVGLLLLLLLIGGLLVGVAPIGRGRDRPLYAAVFAATLAWAFHAGLDWDWEMPAVTLWVFVLGGLALGRTPKPKGAGRLAQPTAPPPRRPRGVVPVAVGMATLVSAVAPALVLGSQARLDNAIDSFVSNDCAGAVRDAGRADNVLASRAQPLEVIALCHARDGRYAESLAVFRRAVDRDPDNWRLRAWMSAAVAAAGQDPRVGLARAVLLNPLDVPLARLRASVLRSRPARWPALGKRYLRDQGSPER